MNVIPVTIDAETYYDKDYSLRKMTPEEYIRDPRFEIIGISVQPHGKRAKFFSGTVEELKAQLSKIPWDKVWCIAHNNIAFDSLVLTEKLGFFPRRWGCTLSMARQALPDQGNYSLEALAKRFGLPAKGTAVHDMKGKRASDMSEEDWASYTDYCNHDSELCTAIFNILINKLPAKDMQAIHWFTKMFAQPRLELDGHAYDLFAEQLANERQALLDRLGLDVKDLRSDKKFAELLRGCGVEPPTKISKKTGKTAFAFAKTDKGMTALLDHGKEYVRLLAEARLKTKTSIEQTRVDRFRGIARRGKLPAPLIWGATQTCRAAGGGKINLQNMGRGRAITDNTLPGTLIVTPNGLRTFDEFDPESGVVSDREGGEWNVKDLHCFGLRDGVAAPHGHQLVVVDSSNIELRVAHTLAGQMDTVEKLHNGEDLYAWFASDLYGYPVNKKDHPGERFHGKVAMLQLQYQSGWSSFQNAARVMGGLELSEENARGTVDFYRTRFPMLPKLWKRCEKAIRAMASGREMAIDQWGLCVTGKNCIYLPRGRKLVYPNLREVYDEDWDGMQWVYDDKRKRVTKKLYGGAVTENLCQALAGIIVCDQCLEIERVWGGYSRPTQGVVLTVHDEAVTVVKSEQAQDCLDHAIKTMATPPDWWPQLPVAAEGDIAQRYGSAK